MCGRFANALNRNDYRRAVARQLPRDTPPPRPSEDADDYRPSYNVAPHSRVPVIRRALPGERQQGSENEDAQDELILQTMKWGLVPRSAKHPPSGPDAFRTINARDDTIFSSSRSMWHPLLPSQRCVIFCQGFYEWQKRPLGSSESESKVERVPHFVGMCDDGEGRTDAEGKERRLMPLAGLWEKVTYEGQTEPLYTFTIITTESNKQLNFLHDRMPVILDTPSEIALWLGISPSSASSSSSSSNSFTPAVARLLRPYQRSLACYKVPREVGKVGNDSPGFIQPVAGRKDGIQAFFGKQQRAQAKAQTEESSGKRSQDETQFRQSDPEEGKEGKKDAASPNANESGAKGNSTPESSLGAQDLAHANAREKADALELTEQTEVEVQYEAKAEADTSDELVTATASAEAEAQAQARAAYMDMYEQDRDQEEERQGKERRAQIEADHAFAMRLAHGDDADGDGEGDERSQGQGKGPARTEKETEVAVPAREVGDGFGTPAPAPDASSTTSTDENANKRHAPSGASAVPEWARAESGRREGRAGEEEQGGRAPRPTKRARHGSSPDVSSYVHAQEGKEANEEGASASSKFSPEPFNPPISPPRPSGGYTSGSGSGSGSNPVRAHAHAHAEDKDGDGAERRSPGKGKGKGGAGNSTGTRGAGKATSGRSAGAKARTKEKDLEKAAQGVPDIRRFFGS